MSTFDALRATLAVDNFEFIILKSTDTKICNL